MNIVGKKIFSLLGPQYTVLKCPTRFAGHAKWQNIKNTKHTQDSLKSKVIGRYVQMVRRAVIAGGRQPDPKINTKLGDVMSEAFKMNVPRATLERAIDRAMKVKIEEKLVEIQGPGGCAVVCKCETENISALRREIKKAVKKMDANIVSDGKLLNMFEEKGYIRASSRTKSGTEINSEAAEESAIEAGAEEVVAEDYGEQATNGGATTPTTIWVFITEGSQLYPCKSRLESMDFEIISAELELKPYRRVDFGEKVNAELDEMLKALSEISEVIDITHNVDLDADR